MSVWTAINDPLQGKASLSKVFWVYGILGSVVVSALGLLVDPGNELMMRIYTLLSVLFSVYATVATYRCAGNCASKTLARFVRISAVISLIVIPVFAYLELTGALGGALMMMGGEQ